MRVPEHHAVRLPAAQFFEFGEIVVFRVVPSRPCVPATMRVKILDTGAPACSFEGGLDPGASGGVVGVPGAVIGIAIRPAEHLASPALQICQRGYHTGVKPHTASIAVLCLRKLDVGTGQVDVAPVKPQGLTSASASVEQENHQRP